MTVDIVDDIDYYDTILLQYFLVECPVEQESNDVRLKCMPHQQAISKRRETVASPVRKSTSKWILLYDSKFAACCCALIQ